jgi:hypothetical protein
LAEVHRRDQSNAQLDHVAVGYGRFVMALRDQPLARTDIDVGDGAYNEQPNVRTDDERAREMQTPTVALDSLERADTY